MSDDSGNPVKDQLADIFQAVFRRRFPDWPIVAAQVEEWDSLKHIELVMEIETRWGFEVDPDDIRALFSDSARIEDYVSVKLSRQ